MGLTAAAASLIPAAKFVLVSESQVAGFDGHQIAPGVHSKRLLVQRRAAFGVSNASLLEFISPEPLLKHLKRSKKGSLLNGQGLTALCLEARRSRQMWGCAGWPR